MTATPDEPHLGLVVEGRGEVEAVPLLIRRWLQEERNDFRDLLGKPVSCNGRDRALMPNGVEGKVATAAARPGCAAVLVVLDSEGDAVCPLGPNLLNRATAGAMGKPVELNLADSKYESWLVASAETMDLSGLAFSTDQDPTRLLKDALQPTKYVKPRWQPRLTARMDFSRALGRSSSLSRLMRIVDSLIQNHL